MSIGREGPLIELGGALGAAIGRAAEAPLTQARVLVAAGTAAGFAAAYNTPFAAVLFVLETIVGVAAPELLLPVMTGTVAATLITRATLGPGPIYGQRTYFLESGADLLLAAALGVLAAFAAIVFKQVLASFEDWFEQHPVPQLWRAMIGGCVVGAIAMWPAVAGNGYEPLNRMLDSPMTLGVLALMLVAKVVTTSASVASVASGVPGGIFTPMLLVGATLGSAWSHLSVIHGGMADSGRYLLMGMAATTAASIHAPLTGRRHDLRTVWRLPPLALPLMVATIVSTTLSRALGSESVYETELRKRGLGWDITLEGRKLRSGAPSPDDA